MKIYIFILLCIFPLNINALERKVRHLSVEFPSVNTEFIEKNGEKLDLVLETKTKLKITFSAKFSSNGSLKQLMLENLKLNELPLEKLKNRKKLKYLIVDNSGKEVELVFTHSGKEPYGLKQLEVYPIVYPSEKEEVYVFLSMNKTPIQFKFKYN